jgi:hypothetical protein
VRQIVYHLKNDRGYRIKKVTLDGFQSTDTLQQLAKRKFQTEYISVDKDILPYHDLREAIYEERVEFPRFMSLKKHGDLEPVEIAVHELLRLIEKDNGKIDHPEGGSKDVSDAMAGVVTTLMGDRTYRRGVSSQGSASATVSSGNSGIKVPGFSLDDHRPPGLGGYGMPVMPNYGSVGSLLPPLPARLAPRRD